MMISHRIAICVLLLTLIGCQSKTPPANPTTTAEAAPSAAPVAVTIGLNWYPEAEHGGFYAALVHGYFKEDGLDVTIRPGGPNVRVIDDVASRVIEFAVDNADKLLLLRAKKADVVSVMSPIQNSPRCIMVHKSSGLNRLEDLSEKKPFTLAMNQGQPFSEFLKKKLKLDQVQIVPFPGGIAAFLEDANYGQQAYSFSEPFLAEQQGSDPQCLMLSELGFNTYTSVLITRNEMLDKRPDVVAKVMRASIRGWKKYLAEPEETNKSIHQENPKMGLEILAFGAKAMKDLCLPEGFDESRLGEMTDERWQTLITQMTEIGSIKPDSVAAGEAFTQRFLETK